MALPDLDPAEISWIAYWNHLDNGADSIDPMEVASALDSYQEYTNGIQGLYTFSEYDQKSRTFRVRVKDDGWFVVWLDRTANESNSSYPGSLDGPYDIVFDWTFPYYNGGAGDADKITDHTAHSMVIQNLRSYLSNSGGSTFNHTDVGIYLYEAEDATTVTLFSVSDGSFSASLTPSSGTTLWWGWLTASATAGSNTVDWDSGSAIIEPWGAREVVDRGEVQAGTQTSTHQNRNETTQETHANVLLAWS